MTEKKSIARLLQEKSLAAKEAVVNSAQSMSEEVQERGAAVASAVGEGVQKGAQAVADGAQSIGEGVQEHGAAVASAVGGGAQKGAQAVADGAQAVGEGIQQHGPTVARAIGEGAQKGVQVVKEHPKEAAIVAGAVVVAAAALPFVPGSPAVAAAVVASVAKGAMSINEALEDCDGDEQPSEERGISSASGFMTAMAAGATAADNALDNACKSQTTK